MAAKSSRKRRKERRRSAGAPAAEGAAPEVSSMERGYARGRKKDEEARRALKPLASGERPTAVTVGAIAATLLALANGIAVILGWDGGPGGEDDGAQRLAGSLVATGVLALVAYGMWRSKYWAVLGMQTLLGITLVVASLALVGATSWWATLVILLILAAAGTLFWFMVKAMARIQMPERPGSTGRR